MVEAASPEATDFYGRALEVLEDTGVPFLVGGAYAMQTYADVVRETKDLDVFCKSGDHPRLLHALGDAGFATEITDATWLAKAFEGEYYVDLIFGAANGASTVDDSWFEHGHSATVAGRSVTLVSPEDQIWQKCFVQDRARYDGADIAHIIRKSGPSLDWQRLLTRMEAHWELLFAHLVLFRYIYPAERHTVPQWVLEEMQSRLTAQFGLPEPAEAICRGPLLSKTQYTVDIQQWGYRER